MDEREIGVPRVLTRVRLRRSCETFADVHERRQGSACSLCKRLSAHAGAQAHVESALGPEMARYARITVRSTGHRSSISCSATRMQRGTKYTYGVRDVSSRLSQRVPEQHAETGWDPSVVA